MPKNPTTLPQILTSTWIAILSSSMLAQARAGGGHSYHSSGGGSSHSYGGGGGGGSSFHSQGGSSGGSGSFSGLILMLFFGILVYYIWKKIEGQKKLQGFKDTLNTDFQSSLRKRIPTGSPEALRLKEKLEEVFVSIQKAWDKGKMDSVRSILSDGVYHRFQIQLEMNKFQGMRNKVEQPTLLESKILGEETYGHYSSIDFLIRGRVVDSDIGLSDSSLIRGGTATVFEEIWSFTRLADAQVTDPLGSLASCPKCAAPLSDAGGSRCGHCGTVLNSGAYDWVLAEITQAEEWAVVDRRNLQQYYSELPTVPGEDVKAWLSPQELEDRASVVFIRYQSALHKKNLGPMNIFVTPKLLSGWNAGQADLPQYNLALGAVDLLGFAESQGMVKAWIRVKYSASSKAADEAQFQERILIFTKAIEGRIGKGNLSCMSCPSCGGPIESSDQAKCAYCENVLSSTSANWVLSEYGSTILLSQLVSSLRRTQPLDETATAKSSSHVQIRILSAFVLAALDDKVVTQVEESTIRDFARHFGVGSIFVDLILKKAKENSALLEERLDLPLAIKWLNNLIMVAASDGKITREEEALLISFARRNGIEEKHVRTALKSANKIMA